jgi:hypothetical protein
MSKSAKKKSGQPKQGKILSRDQPDDQEGKVERVVVPGTAVMVKELITASCVRTRLKWFARIAITSTSGAVAQNVLRHNGLLDVDVTGGATQPEGFDEWMTMYDRFRVVASKLKLKSASSGTTNLNGSFICVLTPSTSATVYATIADAESAPFAISKMYSFGGNPLTMSKYLSVSTLVGISPQAVLAEQSYSGTVGADPGDPTYWHLTFQAMDAATTTSAYLFVEIEFLVDFFDRNNFAMSVDADGNPVRIRKYNLRKQEKLRAQKSNASKTLKRTSTF